jgi:hypothetical protein
MRPVTAAWPNRLHLRLQHRHFREISGLRRQQLQLTPFVMVCAIMIADRTIL